MFLVITARILNRHNRRHSNASKHTNNTMSHGKINRFEKLLIFKNTTFDLKIERCILLKEHNPRWNVKK